MNENVEKDGPNVISEELFWIQARKLALGAIEDTESGRKQETFLEKGLRKFRENPFVPIGAIVTAYVLSKGVLGIRKGSYQSSQFWMRSRIYAQGFTIIALAIGAYVQERKLAKTIDNKNDLDNKSNKTQ
ncbi:unnamed protein product [Gordionus sp. m RMFG-2023]|uniref:HIG1 domain family member 2A, mitochondrial-like n=1 Tax=Gordionus sp. m RMFG-2023 TaxID=3053472 RepID=UPI0030E5073D